MIEFLLFANPIALIALLWYQHYRLKLLAESIAEKRKLISDTKDVVTQQATAISSQATVVDTAIKYTQAFDPAKLEDLIRRQLTAELGEEKRTLQDQVSHLQGRQSEVVEQVASRSADYFIAILRPILSEYVSYLYSLEPEKREKAVAAIGSDQARQIVGTILNGVSVKLAAAQAGTAAA